MKDEHALYLKVYKIFDHPTLANRSMLLINDDRIELILYFNHAPHR